MSTAEPVLYDGEPPPIWLWYRIYAVSMGLLNGFVASILVVPFGVAWFVQVVPATKWTS